MFPSLQDVPGTPQPPRLVSESFLPAQSPVLGHSGSPVRVRGPVVLFETILGTQGHTFLLTIVYPAAKVY